MSGYKKDEEGGGGVGSFFQDKTTVIQEARVFNETPISPRKCRILLTKIVYLLYVGETFGTQEATTLFFGVTKLFQHKDSALRQMVYLVIKELSHIAEDVIMVTSSIMKDMQPNLEVIYRPNAIRALCRVIDGSMIVGVERFFKAAIVDRNTSISSAALVSSYHLHPIARDVIKRWANEASEAVQNKAPSYGNQYGQGYQAVQSSSAIVQYHALGLLYLIRQGDRMAVTKMIQQLSGSKGSGGTLRSPLAICMLIRFAAKVMEEDPNLQRAMFELIEGYLKHKSDMVNYEAARAICEMRNVGASELQRPIAVLQLFLSSPKATLKFAAIRTLAKLAQTHPNAVQVCNLDMEKLINDDNRSVATFAITTLLKTGNEASVDRLMKQISAFMSEISDEFKVIVVNAIRALCLKFPAKQSVMLNFLSGILRDEGGYDFKRAVVEAIFDMIKFIGDSKEAALAQLCEFIEDCEFTKLSVRILHLLGIEGPKAAQPNKYIRYIYNRVILENAIVRAAAVSSLAKFGINVADNAVKRSVKVLLTRCLDDVDDEVRDRAAFNLKLMQDEPLANTFVRDDSTFSLDALESRLAAYIADTSSAEQPFDLTAVPKVSKEQVLEQARASRKDAIDVVAMTSEASGSATPAAAAASASETQSAYAKQLAEVPEFAEYGAVLKSSPKPIELTERETEYVVSAVKHVFAEHVVFQFNVRNTVEAVHLENVVVVMHAHSVQPVMDAQLRSLMGQFGGGAQPAVGGDHPTNDNAETVHISSLALLKMLKHGRAGVPLEVMGLMLGDFVDEYTVRVIDVFAMPQSGTGVSVEAVDPVFQTKMLDMLKQTGRPEMVVGWYHSHPGFGCWLSSVDVNTQQSFEQLNPRAVAVVIDPIQSVKGKVVIDAFRSISPQQVMMGIEPRQSTSNVGHLQQPSIQALIHGLNRHYYSIAIAYRKTDLEQSMLLNLHKKNWTEGLRLKDWQQMKASNEESIKRMLQLAQAYTESVQEEATMTPQQLKTRHVGKQDPKRHLEEAVETAMGDSIVQSLGTMMSLGAL